jgi:hypothetical protein
MINSEIILLKLKIEDEYWFYVALIKFLYSNIKACNTQILHTCNTVLKFDLLCLQSFNTTYTRCQIPEDCFLHSHHRESLKSYILFNALHDKN